MYAKVFVARREIQTRDVTIFLDYRCSNERLNSRNISVDLYVRAYIHAHIYIYIYIYMYMYIYMQQRDVIVERERERERDSRMVHL